MTEKLIERAKVGLHDALSKELPDMSSNAPVLDIGCGTGAWLERLAEIGFSNLYGVDLDIEQFQSISAKAFCLNLDSDEIPEFGIDQFELITAIELVEHLENPGRLFTHISRLLSPNGYVLITTPNIHSMVSRLRFLLTGRLRGFDDKGDPTHINPVYITSLERILERYGLTITSRTTYPKKGSITSRTGLKLMAYILSFVLGDDLSGDNMFLLIRRANLSSK